MQLARRRPRGAHACHFGRSHVCEPAATPKPGRGVHRNPHLYMKALLRDNDSRTAGTGIETEAERTVTGGWFRLPVHHQKVPSTYLSYYLTISRPRLLEQLPLPLIRAPKFSAFSKTFRPAPTSMRKRHMPAPTPLKLSTILSSAAPVTCKEAWKDGGAESRSPTL
jgi:hypothetical protein